MEWMGKIFHRKYKFAIYGGEETVRFVDSYWLRVGSIERIWAWATSIFIWLQYKFSTYLKTARVARNWFIICCLRFCRCTIKSASPEFSETISSESTSLKCFRPPFCFRHVCFLVQLLHTRRVCIQRSSRCRLQRSHLVFVMQVRQMFPPPSGSSRTVRRIPQFVQNPVNKYNN